MAGGIDPLFENHPELVKARADADEVWGQFLQKEDKSETLKEVRRKMRAKILALNDDELRHLYYEAITLSEHEAARIAADRILKRAHLSNRAEA